MQQGSERNYAGPSHEPNPYLPRRFQYEDQIKLINDLSSEGTLLEKLFKDFQIKGGLRQRFFGKLADFIERKESYLNFNLSSFLFVAAVLLPALALRLYFQDPSLAPKPTPPLNLNLEAFLLLNFILDFLTGVVALRGHRSLAVATDRVLRETVHLMGFPNGESPDTQRTRGARFEALISRAWHAINRRLTSVFRKPRAGGLPGWLLVDLSFVVPSCAVGIAWLVLSPPVDFLSSIGVFVYMSFITAVVPIFTWHPGKDQKGATRFFWYTLRSHTPVLLGVFFAVMMGVESQLLGPQSHIVWNRIAVFLESASVFFFGTVAYVTLLEISMLVNFIGYKKYIIALDPLDSYGSGGLRPYGDVLQSSSYVLLILAGLQLSKALLLGPLQETLSQPYFVQGSLGLPALLGLNYGVPVFLLHRRIKQLKSSWLANLYPIKIKFLQESSAYSVFGPKTGGMPVTTDMAQRALFERIRRISEWPVTGGGFSRLVSATLLPLATYLLQYFILRTPPPP
jgi:hypothetical protein